MSKIKYIYRNYNVINQEETLEDLYTYKDFPVYIGCTDKSVKTDLKADLSVTICKKTGIMQLDKLLPLEIVYGDYHSEAIGSLWQEHHFSFIDFIQKYKPKNVLEIGGSNGFVAKEMVKREQGINNWIMVEPAPAYKGDEKIKIIKKNFDENFKYKGKIDTVVHSHTFEHIYEPGLFMKYLGKFIKNGNHQIFSVPNLQKYLENMQANWINFEHNVYLSEEYIDYLLSVNGFEILEKKYFYEHSIFYATKKIGNFNREIKLNNGYKKNKKLFNKFNNFYSNFVSDLNSKIASFDGNVYLFGAHIFSQFFSVMGLTGNIIGVLDNSKIKEGKRLYGTNYTVFNPEVIRNKKNVMVIVRAGAYQDEVKKQLLNINPTVNIIE